MTQEAELQVAAHSVGIVGGRGAGKTTYLVNLYHALAFQPENVGFYIEAPINQSKRLVSMFSTLSEHDWLAGTTTRTVEKWDFSLGVMAGNKGWEACKFIYYDYGGGLIEDNNPDIEEQTKEIAQKFTQCQAIIAFLDGQKISNFITGEDPDAREKFIHQDLRNIMAMITPAVRSGNLRSLQFVITKWDYVEKTGQPLGEIRKLLLSLSHFDGFLKMLPVTGARIEEQQNAASPGDGVRTLPLIRLIPVSAVGFNFVKGFSPERGMIINEQAQPEPWNVAAPLACAFVDIIKAELEGVQKRKAAVEAQKYSTSQTGWDWLKHYAITKGLEYIPRKYINNVHVLQIVKDMLEEHAYSIQEREDARYRDFTARKDASIRSVTNNEAAFAHAVTMCHMIQQNLDKEFPANVIQ
jgi:hypothetical protein